MKGCVYCQVMAKYFKSMNLNITVVDIDEFIKTHISNSEKEMFIKKIQTDGISLPYSLYTLDGLKWDILDMSTLIRQHLVRYGDHMKSIKA